MSIGLALSGALGRMGRRVAEMALAGSDFRVAAAIVARGSPERGKDYGVALGRDPLGVILEDRLPGKADVLVDFSTPEGAAARARECGELAVPLVVGTTALGEKAMEELRRTAKRVAVLVAPNLSVGVAAVADAVRELARRLGRDYDAEIVEVHHRGKRDAPSGTALALADALGERPRLFGRKGEAPARPGEVGIHAVRAGGIVGEHRVIFAGEHETIEVVHRAGSRDLFAAGALRAARFVVSATPGLYSMRDALG